MTITKCDRSNVIWDSFEGRLQFLIRDRELKDVCDVGGGAHPMLPMDFVLRSGVNYSVLDISREEMSGLPPECISIVADIASPSLSLTAQFDLVFTKMLAEHVKSGKQMHENIYGLLKPGGYAVHFFPTLYAPPFVVNWLLSERFATHAYNLFAPDHRKEQRKFPAYYSWCRGPSRAILSRLSRVGYEVVEYWGLYGHHDYYERLPAIKMMHERNVRFLLKAQWPYLTSYAYVVLRKPINE
jgi:SAM-dependent methyltransferase